MSDRLEEQVDEADRWVRLLLKAHGIQAISFGGGERGLLNVPAKWCALIGDMHTGLRALAAGKKLPLIRTPKEKTRRRR
jgi:hypothetical protein